MQEIHLANIAAWEAFVSENREGIESQGYSVADALEYACEGGLELGGGAAPLTIVYVGSKFAPL